MKIDAHQHFWQFNPQRDAWINEEMAVLKRDFLPEDLQPILKTNNIDGCIAVQADQSEKETEFLLGLAKDNSFIKGVVGWLDLCSDTIDERLAYYSKYEKLKGLRHIVQAEPAGFMLRKDFQRGIKALEKYNLTYDILVHYNQLEEVVEFVREFPNQKFVLDHIGKPSIKVGEIDTWKIQIEALATFPNVYCKASGLVTETSFNNWSYTDFVPYLEVVFNSFGVDRVLFGSDWPVCLLSGNYEKVLAIIERYILKFSVTEKELIMGKNAVAFYNLKYYKNE
ncbi:amidohydrolase family protein [Polaribacter sp. IC073]|uniref:amidohydrolase family protein n=1 Tax=Polaribacter sp. IC073 TaxID=2508540 RepID=UPI0011BD5E3C|nr:amidohydrolase family protein [Polaribacter sp. IC073]TXD46781.1 amidohydrolase family protein [Polaribacter sp. IC073]